MPGTMGGSENRGDSVPAPALVELKYREGDWHEDKVSEVPQIWGQVP